MAYRISGLDPAPFRHLFGLDDAALRAHGAIRYRVDAPTGYPDRIELRDLVPGETALLVNHVHQPADTPYRASHAIFVQEGAVAPVSLVDSIPPALRRRPLSLRAFDASHLMVAAALAQGDDVAPAIERLLDDDTVVYVHAHYAVRGCYAALIERAV